MTGREASTLPLLVTVGTDHHPFNRLIDWLDRWLAEEAADRVHCVVQHGTSRPPKHGEAREYFDHEELQGAMARAAVVVCHAGPATLTEARRAGRLPVVVPRDPENAEHVDDHQLRFVRHLEERHLVVRCALEQEFRDVLNAALAEPERYQLPEPTGGPDDDAPVPEPVRRAGALIDDLLGIGESSPNARAVGDSGQRAGEPPTAWPSVTAVIATKDRPELLREAVTSVVGQDYPGKITCLVVFDGTPPDHTLATASGDRSVEVTSNVRTPGLAGGRNSGILSARDELIAFCDDDDAWLPGKLRAQVEALHANPGSAVACCGIRIRYGDRSVDRSIAQHHVSRHELLRSRLTELHPSTFVIRRDALVDGFGLVDEILPGSYAEDYELLLRAAAYGPVVNVPEVLTHIRWHAQSHFAHRHDIVARALSMLLERHPDFRSVPRGYARVAGQIAFARAALGDRSEALRWAWRALHANPAEPRAYLAVTVAIRVLSSRTVLNWLHLRGRGL